MERARGEQTAADRGYLGFQSSSHLAKTNFRISHILSRARGEEANVIFYT